MKYSQTKGIHQKIKGAIGIDRGPPRGQEAYLLLHMALRLLAKVTAGRKSGDEM